jgi:hypothetical protein
LDDCFERGKYVAPSFGAYFRKQGVNSFSACKSDLRKRQNCARKVAVNDNSEKIVVRKLIDKLSSAHNHFLADIACKTLAYVNGVQDLKRLFRADVIARCVGGNRKH